MNALPTPSRGRPEFLYRIPGLTTSSPTGVPVSIRPLLANAEKLGQWCSDLSLFETAAILKVRF